MKSKENGFGVIGILLVIMVVGLVSFAGWFVYQANEEDAGSINSSQTTETVSKANEEPAKPAVDPVDIAKQFIGGMQNGNKKQVDGLMSPLFKSSVKAESGSESFYDGCVKAGSGPDSCIDSFKAFDLSKASPSQVVDYSAEREDKGKSVEYFCSDSQLQGKPIRLCYTFRLFADGNSWLIDNIIETTSSIR